jgi:hypothetical protein
MHLSTVRNCRDDDRLVRGRRGDGAEYDTQNAVVVGVGSWGCEKRRHCSSNAESSPYDVAGCTEAAASGTMRARLDAGFGIGQDVVKPTSSRAVSFASLPGSTFSTYFGGTVQMHWEDVSFRGCEATTCPL